MQNRFVFIHGNHADHWSFAWTPWLKEQLELLGHQTFFETFPDSILARSEYWLPFLKDRVKADEKTILIGWSSGAVAAMRFAEENKIRGSILISPCYTDLGDEIEKQSGYFNTEWNWEKIKQNQEKIAVFYGDNDPYIPQDQFTHIANKLSATTVKVLGGGHFMEGNTFPELLDYIKQNSKIS